MAFPSPLQSKRVLDPDTEDIDGLVFCAVNELHEVGLVVKPETVARRLGVPLGTIQQHWQRLAGALVETPA